jgi:hypothetical protein
MVAVHVPRSPHGRIVPPAVVGRQHHPGARGSGDHGPGVTDAQRQRFLAQDVPAGLRGGDRLDLVTVVRRAHVHGVDLGIGQQNGQGVVAAVDLVPPRIVLAPLRRPAVDGDDAAARSGADAGDDRRRGDLARPDQPPPHTLDRIDDAPPGPFDHRGSISPARSGAAGGR